ncbi:MAG: hypothetical protein LKM32_13430 [Chiayiivirga sp.]|uniref:hypothetical protein n=1 Tax=Chiayiivirga sp. TaxID=2041042 RepID=UPI0025BE5493|nr:hypothetical protein [Chiayiivirga sp.]MCI1709908.1 hypothetical protein [Chiayiivirga sp.]MCI1730331.1 hypothetical protein [Chiayiivirga sp.]
MHPSKPQFRKWRRYTLAALTLVVIACLAAHPELRLLVPILDAVGLDGMMLLIGAQAFTYGRFALRQYALPTLRQLYRGMTYLLGIAGPGADALARRHPILRSTLGLSP